MKATLEDLQDLGLEVINGKIMSVRLTEQNSLLIKVSSEEEEIILIELSNKELEEYYDYYTISGIITTKKYMLDHISICRKMIEDLGKLNHEVNNILNEDFLNKDVVVTKQELVEGDPIIQLNGKPYVNVANKSWIKYLLYSWQ